MNQEKQALKARLSLRPASASDARILTTIYVESRREELAPLGWSDEQLTAFCRMQFVLQTQAYQMQFPGALGYVVEMGGRAIGRLLVNHGEREIRLVDIAFLPEFRNLGAGTILIENLQREAETTGKMLELRVLTTNAAAVRLYERLGFVVAENNQTHLSMRWRACGDEKQSTE
ncbi:MAG TPA: GNAT family N-acetyltransferase [Pyrinomonadaceae bacterium]